MTNIRTDLSALALDLGDKMLERAKTAAADEAEILKWGANECKLAAEKWADDAVSDAVFKDWIRNITLVRVPAKTAALVKFEAKQATQMFIGGIFQALAILAGAL